MKRTALITGSSRGIGKAVALLLARNGYNIVLHGSKNSVALASAERELKQLGVKPLLTVFDVSDSKAVAAACGTLLDSVGAIDILVNTAGILKDGTLLKMSEESWDSVIRTNLYGPFFVTKHLLPKMVENGFGRIVNFSSIAARGAFGKANYAAAKAGLIGFTKSLALEVGKYNVTVNAISPGYIETEMSASIPEKYRQRFLEQIALGRIGSPEEVAGVVAYLVSDECSYVSGAVVDVNGGWL